MSLVIQKDGVIQGGEIFYSINTVNHISYNGYVVVKLGGWLSLKKKVAFGGSEALGYLALSQHYAEEGKKFSIAGAVVEVVHVFPGEAHLKVSEPRHNARGTVIVDTSKEKISIKSISINANVMGMRLFLRGKEK